MSAKQETQEKPLLSPDKLRSRYGKFLDLDRDLNRYTCKFDKKTILKNEAKYWRDHFERHCEGYKELFDQNLMATQTKYAGPATKGPAATSVARRRAGPPSVPPIVITIDDEDDDKAKENGEALQPLRAEQTVPPKTPNRLKTTDENKQALTPPTTSPTFNNCTMGSPFFNVTFGPNASFGIPLFSQEGAPRGPEKSTIPVEKQQHGHKGGEGPPAERDVPPRPGRAAPAEDTIFVATGNDTSTALVMIQIRLKENDWSKTTLGDIRATAGLAETQCSEYTNILEGIFYLAGTNCYYATFRDDAVANETRRLLMSLMKEKNKNISSVVKTNIPLPVGATRVYPVTKRQ